MKRILKIAAAVLSLFVVFVFLNNTALLAPAATDRPVLLAHRGLAQTYRPEGLTAETCTAARIDPPEHPYLENTVASMEAAFRAGANVVELDIHPTSDGEFAVFHDWTLDCRTEGHGVTRSHTMAELKQLDVGYGYTADGGKTFPFRGKGVGQMPSLDEVLQQFPDRRFLIHIKSKDASEGELLAKVLARLPAALRARLMVYGGDPPVEAVRRQWPDIRTMSVRLEKSCMLPYIGLGWSGYVPPACRNAMLLIPANYAPWMWGWPGRFLQRMRGVGAEVFVLGPLEGDDFSRGIDTAAEAKALPAGFSGGIWTNRIDRIAPAIGASRPD